MTDKEFEALEIMKNAFQKALELHPHQTYAKSLGDYALAFYRERDRRLFEAGKKS